MKILVLNGPNLNLLGRRQPEHYGNWTLADIEKRVRASFPNAELEFAQRNGEGQLIDCLHKAAEDEVDGIVFNPGAYSHTSVALRDAIAAIEPPVVEVHISNIYARDAFRHHSLLAPVCRGQMSGFGPDVYRLGIFALLASADTQLED